MNDQGLAMACRYSYPPNSLSLCGPSRQNDLSWYTASLQTDQGTKDILQQFSTLYPYLCFIAGENHLKNPLEKQVIEAYWVGNSLLLQTKYSDFIHFLDEDLSLPKKLPRQEAALLKNKAADGALPHHAFHVLNIYRRTGHWDIPHTIETMDACIINWGKIKSIQDTYVVVDTQPLVRIKERLTFGAIMKRKLRMQGEKDSILPTLSAGDWVSYHWGHICEKLSNRKLKNLKLYTSYALGFANTTAYD